MVRMRSVLVLALLTASLAAVPAQAQIHKCGDIDIIFKNPDLQPSGDGFIHAQGQFFAQFQAIGQGAQNIATFGFSFGPYSTEYGEEFCDQPIWFTGPYVINYRADRDASDGFFIPLITPLVPDNQYAAAVHVYDAQDNELARFWSPAIVDNCDGAEGSYCRNDADQHLRQDKTAPWPIVLPGDGQAMSDRFLSLEFGEPIDTLKVTLNSEDITSQLSEWDGRIWDADYFPDYGPYGTGSQVSPPCTQPYHTCQKYGPAFEWNERALTDNDVIRVEATDMSGNLAVKDIHIGSSVAGGAISADVPILEWSVDKTEQIVEPGSTAVFKFSLTNSGAAEAHPFAEAEGPEGWEMEWQPNHKPVPSGEQSQQELLVTPPMGTATGIYNVNATMTYQQGGTEKTLEQKLTVNVGNAPPGQTGNQTTETAAPVDEEQDSPGFGILAIFAALAVAFVLRRR